MGPGPLALAPSQPSTLYLWVFERGAFRSTDGGHTWSLANAGLSTANAVSFAVDPGDADTAYLAQINTVEKTTDGSAQMSSRMFVARKV